MFTPSLAPSLAASFESQPVALAPLVEAACGKIPPLWPLKNFVAVNPFVGLTGGSFLQAAHLMRRVAHADIFYSAEFYSQKIASGQIEMRDIEAALKQAAQLWPQEVEWVWAQTPASIHVALQLPVLEPGEKVLSFADFLDAQGGTRWSAFVTEEIAKWCAAFYDAGQAKWTMPDKGNSLWQSWRDVATLDRNPEIAGLKGFRSTLAGLPQTANELIAHGLDLLGVSRANATDFLHRQLLSIPGWSGAVQYQVRENEMAGQSDESLQELLAIRLAYDLALWAAFGEKWENEWQNALEALQTPAQTPADLLRLAVCGRALEIAFARQLNQKIKGANTETVAKTEKVRPAVQAVFCIDVRSEILRRALEGTSDKVETLGFAGFFGFAIEHVPFGHAGGSAQCPVLLTPKVKIGEKVSGDANQVLKQKRRAKTLAKAWSDFKSSAISSFSFVETGGVLSGVQLASHTLGLAPKAKNEGAKPKLDAMPLETQIATAMGALKGMSLHSNFGRLVLLCGHGSQTCNNPYGSGLDCGACGGHTGESNARVAALVFNNPQVRAGLKEQGIEIPEDTHFLAGLHNTTTDEVSLFDLEDVPASHQSDIAQLQKWLASAGEKTRAERAPRMNTASEKVGARANDWSQTRPEWGLAGNAAFIAAPRERTKSLNLEGRVFLHSYDWKLDGDNAILSLIMNAPMVVASWINLQYYASTVSNQTFGAGNKIIHNVVGKMGVAQGNGGDLQVGLPLQSLHDGQKWMHQAQRLAVYLEAPRERISAVIANSPGVWDLVENDWLHIYAIEDEGKSLWRYAGSGMWQVV